MIALAPFLGTLLLLAAAPSPAPSHEGKAASASPSPAPPEAGSMGPVILFLVDNSASLPPLDPEEKRVAALERIFTFLKSQPYRLILFGARREIYVDNVSQYNNRGQWTDFYAAISKARDLVEEYPKGTEFRLVLLTDGIIDPDPAEWKDLGATSSIYKWAFTTSNARGKLSLNLSACFSVM